MHLLTKSLSKYLTILLFASPNIGEVAVVFLNKTAQSAKVTFCLKQKSDNVTLNNNTSFLNLKALLNLKREVP